ncbi:centrosomal protein kizuna-like isoform X2 [Mizuhopecten yessoensis]|uniref:Centrosomal protein kizuna n=1 Tax=Mizuhopecten yessoensis TaxID=6573 RepID=A0A210QXF1_MIZYE|nr:centrosomal protein kizuna-like isoform X2 [Mizuhopecten yessoensis]OWF53393.1 Toll-like receptor 1 [Mizuhopecten yessoensis]
MASSNVQYYQRQKENQDVIHNHESKRANLEQQLKVLAKTDNRLAKLRAAKLKTYWKKICDDQKRAQERNDRIVQEFERIDTFLAASTARTEKLRLLKRQYEEYIEKTYPLWMEQVLHHRQQTQQSPAQGAHPLSSQGPPQPYPQGQPSYPHHQPTPGHTPQSQSVGEAGPPPMEPPRGYKETSTPTRSTYNPSQRDESPEERDSYGHVLTSTPFRGDDQYTQKPKTSSIYANISQVMRNPTDQETVQQQSQPRAVQQQVSHVPAERETTAYQHSVPDQVTDVSFSDDIVEEMVQHPQPIQSVRIGQQVHKPVPESPDISQSLSGPMEPNPVDEVGGDEVSDFGDDDLPLSTSQTGPDQPQKIVTHDQVSPPSSPDATPRDRPIQTAVTGGDSSSSPATPSPELHLDGLVRLITHVQADFPEALSLEGYYRSHRPSASDRRDIMHKGNKGIPMHDQDAEKISMVLLEQLPLVVRNLSPKGLLPDSVLAGNVDSITEMRIRMALPEAAQPLWDCLFDHLSQLVRNKVMVTKEVAAVFVPSLVADYSPYQDRAYNLVIRLLEKFDEYRQAESEGMTPRDTMDSMRSSLGGVPPLKFGSLVDKQFGSDDETTTMLTPSVPTDAPKVPLNETAAYRNMLSGTMSSQNRQQAHVDDEDTDDDVEKQFASALSPRDPPSTIPPPKSFANPTDSKPDNQAEPLSELSTPTQPSPVYVPTAVQKQSVKSALGSTAGSSKSHRKVGIQFSSDLDTDTEPEMPMGRKTEEEQDDFFEFYG